MPNAVVIGAGPSGLSAALGLIKAGHIVTVHEQREKWANRVCGAFLNPEAVRQLHWLGVLDKPQIRQAATVTSAIVHDEKGNSMTVPIEQDGFNGLALSRKDLEDVLVEAVQEKGGTVHAGSRVKETPDADVTVVAGGRYSFTPPSLPVEQHGEENSSPRISVGRLGGGWYGWNATFDRVPQTPGTLSLHFHAGGYVGVITFANGSSNVCGLFKRSGHEPISWEKTHEHAQEKSTSLRKLLANSKRVSEWRGVGPLPFSLSMHKSRVALLAGDAAAVGDPYMGEGLGRALSAGAMIYQAWAENGGQNLNARYRKLWQNHYTARLRLGHLTRFLLGSSPFFQISMRLAFRARGPVVRALPLFHRGFHGSHVSYS